MENTEKTCLRFNWTNCKLMKTIFIVAGTFVVISALLALFVSTLFIIFTILVGIMQIIFGITGFCLLAIILRKMGLKCDIKK